MNVCLIGKSWHTPRRFTSAADQGLDIIWDNNSPSPRTYTLSKYRHCVSIHVAGV